jgi:hypothetical protein
VSRQDETDDGRPFVFFDHIHFANTVVDDGFKTNGPDETRGRPAGQHRPQSLRPLDHFI